MYGKRIQSIPNLMSMTILSEKITSTLDKLIVLTNQFNEQQLKFKSTPTAWNAFECVEHIHLVNAAIVKLLQTPATQSNENKQTELFGEGKLTHLLVTKRELKLVSPERFTPTGVFKNLKTAQQAVQKNKEDLLHVLNTIDLSKETDTFVHPRLGEMTKTDWIHFLIAHTERHIIQLQEMKQHPLTHT